jgi:hypothetical protein
VPVITETSAEIAPDQVADPGEVAPVTTPQAPKLPEEDVVLEEFNARFKHSKDHMDEWRQEARILYDMVAGRQWDIADAEQLTLESRPIVTFNLTGKYIDALVGLQINNRQDIKFLPREMGDAKSNELLTGAVQWGRDLTDVADDETDAFMDTVLVGYGWMQGYLDRDQLPEGVPSGQRVDPLEMYPDPGARKRNLTDAKYCIRIKFVDKDEYEEITGATVTDDNTLAELVAEEDDVLTVVEEPQDYRKPSATDSRKRSKRPVAEYEFWRREDRMIVQVQGATSPTTMEMNEWEVYESLLKRAKWQYTATPIKKKTYYRARICDGKVRELKRSPYQEAFTYHAITGKRDRNKGIFYGIGRALVDPQKWVNKFFSTILYSLMVGAKGGLLAEENAFADPRKAEADWANPSAIAWLKDGALQKGKVQEKPISKYPEGLERLMTFSMNAIPQVSGLNAELLGLADRVQAGVVEAQRKQSAMAIISWAFDAMRRYYRSMGRQMATYVIEYMPENTLIMITGESGRQYVPLIKSQLRQVFDVVVDEAPTSVNMKERVWAVLETLIPQALQAGLKIPQEILDYSPLPTELVDKWKEVLKPDPNQQKVAQDTMMQTLEKLTAEVAKTKAGAALDQAKVAEIMAELQKPSDDPNAEMQMELFKTKMQGEIDSRISELKANRDAETKLMIAEMNVSSKERIAQLEMMIDAKLEQSRMDNDSNLERSRQQSDAQSKVAVAAIARGKPDLEEEDLDKPDPTALVAEAIGELKEAIKEMSKEKPAQKRRFKIKRDKAGNMTEASEE